MDVLGLEGGAGTGAYVCDPTVTVRPAPLTPSTRLIWLSRAPGVRPCYATDCEADIKFNVCATGEKRPTSSEVSGFSLAIRLSAREVRFGP
jgi:hypothetical protein